MNLRPRERLEPIPPTGRVASSRNDLDLYEREAAHWWDADSRFAASLHAINEHRLAEVRARLGERLAGLAVVDLGCGGGLMAEPLARAGARVVGCDLGAATITAARVHGSGLHALHYLRADARRAPLADGCADLVLAADIVEHIDGWQTVVSEAGRLLAPGGLLYVSTINRTWRATLLAVHVAEGLRLVPPRTHDPARFVRPQELAAAGTAAGLKAEPPRGQRLRLWATLRDWRIRVAPGTSTALEYTMWLRRPHGCAGSGRSATPE